MTQAKAKKYKVLSPLNGKMPGVGYPVGAIVERGKELKHVDDGGIKILIARSIIVEVK